ncbi:synaptic vesicle membrane protein VAT-1 homolog isoform X2 [Parasteatoda tepidariorum]|nr:synaptic vesicle membrane protein VAT-1 homolog isoform X2 [Parasteatoda tepidariorum]
METMRAIMLTGFGGYDKIKVQQIPKPKPEKDHVVIEIKACGMNFADLYVRQGIYTYKGVKPPFCMGVEGAGVISEVGENVTEFKMGDRVLCWNFTYGMCAEFVSVHKNQCYSIPENMTYMDANCLITNYVTAYLVVMDFGNLRPGQSILIQAAAGGVGWAATQIAKSIENVQIFGTASSGKHDVIKENGVNHAIDYRTCDFMSEVLRISPSGVHVVLDCLSGNDFIKAQRCLRHMGRIVHVGISSMINGEKRNPLKNFKVWWQTKNISIYNLIQKNNAVCGLSINTIFEEDPECFRTVLDKLMVLYNDNVIKPRIDSVWSFDEVIEATKCMVERKNIGKIVLVPNKEEAYNKVEASFQN